MSRIIPVALSLLWSSLAFAIEAEEPPVESNTTGIVIFFVAVVVCVALYVWFTLRAEKKPDKEKLGDKF
jgi:divalent metal cation (Fe/Co/Zn/Cd) transporter